MSNWISLFLLLLCSFTAFNHSQAQSQNIGGVFNVYATVEEFPTNCQIIVDSIQTFAPGDQILVIQMKGASIVDGDTSTYGNVTSYNGAGNYEIATINNVLQDTILLEHQLTRSYDENGIVQIVGSGQFSSVDVTSELIPRPWNGSKGGIVFIDVTDSITLNANVNVKGQGYRGGLKSNASVNCNLDVYSISNQHEAGEKGESFVIYPQKRYGRGALATGGGGGNNHNSGGAGGGNLGRGGMGGLEYDNGTAACSPTFNNGGIGGKPVSYSAATNRAFMGGGGGGGHQNDFLASPRDGIDGVNGGGLVIFRCNTLIGNNRIIDADGLSQDSLAGRDGAGGGGAGGTIMIETQKVIGSINTFVRGGDGGSLDNALFNSICHGPGGGGGGGVLWLSDPTLQINFSNAAQGGEPGLNINPNSFCYNSHYGSTAGTDGGVRTDLSIPEGDQFCPWSNLFINAFNDTFSVSCGSTYFLNVQGNDLGGSAFSTSILTPPTLGTSVVLNGDSISFSCNDTNGIDSLIYIICLDAFPNLCDTAVVYLNIIQPDADIDYGLTPKNTELAINVTNNDFGGDNYSVTVINGPSNGSATVINPDSILYIPNNGFVGNDTITYILCFEPEGEPCDTAQVIITVYDVIAVDDADTTLQGNPVTTYVVFNDIYTYSIQVTPVCFPDNGSIVVNADLSVTYTPDPGFFGIDQYCYFICNEGLCDTAYVTIFVNEIVIPEIIVPNGFSPNDDGVNDLFVILDIELSNDNILQIFNRWGQEVFSQSNYDNTWDGKNQSGNELPDGTYFYVLNVNDLGENYQGYVVIQR